MITDNDIIKEFSDKNGRSSIPLNIRCNANLYETKLSLGYLLSKYNLMS